MLIEFPPPAKPWSTNQDRSMHWSERSLLVAEWKHAAGIGWRMLPLTVRESWVPCKCEVAVTVPFDAGRRRDPHNYVGTVVKAIVDGLVGVGVWPDDTPEWVRVVEPVLTVGGPVVVELRRT